MAEIAASLPWPRPWPCLGSGIVGPSTNWPKHWQCRCPGNKNKITVKITRNSWKQKQNSYKNNSPKFGNKNKRTRNNKRKLDTNDVQ